MRRRTVASFEEPVKKLSGDYGYIDLFWRGMLLVEHKSHGKDLGKAESQAFRYIQDLAREGRENEIPRYVIVSDFARIALYDLEPEDSENLPLFNDKRVHTLEFSLVDLHQHIHAFAFIAATNNAHPKKCSTKPPSWMSRCKAPEIVALRAGGAPISRFVIES